MIRAEVIAELMSSLTHPGGASGRMCDLEREAGRKIIPVGSNKPFSLLASDWSPRDVISCDGSEVRIIAIMAKKPGNGAFRRLVQNIIAAGLTPVIIEPMGRVMPAIMDRWGWKRSDVGDGFNHEEQWRPNGTR